MIAAAFIFIALLLLVGYVVFSAIEGPRRTSLWQLAGWSASLGAGSAGLLLFWISLAGAAPSRAVLAIVAIAAAGALVLLRWKKHLARPAFRPMDLRRRDAAALAAALIVAAFAVWIAVRAHRSAGAEWDDWAIWGLKAKVLATGALTPMPAYFHDLSMSFSHLDYPLLLPFLNAGIFAAAGEADVHAAAALLPFFFVALALVMYGALRWKLDRTRAATVAAVLLVMPATVRWARAGIADLPLVLFYAAGVHFAIRWAAGERKQDLALAILFGAFTAFTKAEGLPLVLLTALALAIVSLRPFRPKALARAALFAAGVLLLDLPWLLVSAGLPRTHEDYGARLSVSVLFANLPRLGHDVVPAMLAQIPGFWAWGLLWIALLGTAILGWRAFGQRHAAGLWCILVLHLGLIAFVYVITPWDVRTLFAMSLDRVLLHAAPVAAFLVGYHWAAAGRNP